MEAPVVPTEPKVFAAVKVVPHILLPSPPSPFAYPHASAAGTTIDQALQDAGFKADLSSVTSAVPYSLTASLSFDQTGRLQSLLIERFEGDKSMLVPLRLSLLTARTMGPANGKVTMWREGR